MQNDPFFKDMNADEKHMPGYENPGYENQEEIRVSGGEEANGEKVDNKSAGFFNTSAAEEGAGVREGSGSPFEMGSQKGYEGSREAESQEKADGPGEERTASVHSWFNDDQGGKEDQKAEAESESKEAEKAYEGQRAEKVESSILESLETADTHEGIGPGESEPAELLASDPEDEEKLGSDFSKYGDKEGVLKEDDQRVYAGFFARLTAYILDRLILLIPLGTARLILFFMANFGQLGILKEPVFFKFTPADIILYLFMVLYFVITTYVSGSTLGKWIMRLKVVSTEDRKPSLFEIIFRETFGRFLSSFIIYIGYLMIVVGDQKEALHDRLADTRVIYR